MKTIPTTLTMRPLNGATISSGRGLAIFFALTLGWMGLCGGLAILVAHGWLTLPLSPLALISIGGLMPMLAAVGAAAYETGPQQRADHPRRRVAGHQHRTLSTVAYRSRAGAAD